jgi:type IV pilus assembly protein PilO
MSNLGKVFTWLNAHIAIVALLVGFNLFIGVKLLLAWHATSADAQARMDRDRITAAQLQSQMSQLTGLPQKVDQARKDADAFYASRFAPNYSTVAAELGDLFKKSNVRWSRAQYTRRPAIAGLSEIRIDANLSGEYAPLMHFINDLERDKSHVFFMVNGLTFTGQQGGLVNLRLRLTTFIHANGDNDVPVSVPSDTAPPQEVE